MQQKNIFIAFEGIDGCGKSTQIKILEETLRHEGHKVYTTAEPTNSAIGRIIRDVLNHKTATDHRVIAALFVADRLHHLLNNTDGILKKLKEGYTVIMDRYYLSSYAYQGTYVPMDWVMAANALSVQTLRPDINVYIDIDAATAIQRVYDRKTNVGLDKEIEEARASKQKTIQLNEVIEKEIHQEEKSIATFSVQTLSYLYKSRLSCLEAMELIETSINELENKKKDIELYETKEALAKIRATYLDVIQRLESEENIFTTNGNRAIADVAEDIWGAVLRCIHLDKGLPCT